MTGRSRTVKLQCETELPANKDLIEFGRYEVVWPKTSKPLRDLMVDLPMRPYELRVIGRQ